jgi:hypothetical protein
LWFVHLRYHDLSGAVGSMPPAPEGGVGPVWRGALGFAGGLDHLAQRCSGGSFTMGQRVLPLGLVSRRA